MSSPSEPRPGSPADPSDNDSILSDVDEAQFEDFDPANVAIDRPPVLVHEGNLKLIGRHKRKRDGNTDEVGGKKKKKEGKRERSRKKNSDDDDDNFSGGQQVEGKRIRKKKHGTEGGRREKTRARKATPEDEESLDPEESQ